jgi:ATP-dependent Clp protease ATP-binding subunit ClpA
MHPYFDFVTDRARKALEKANDHARFRGDPLVTSLHILWGLVDEDKNVASQVLKNLKADTISRTLIEQRIGKRAEYKSHGSGVPYSEDGQLVICRAIDLAHHGVMAYVGCQHLLLAMLSGPDIDACILLENHDITQELAEAEINAIVKPL